jgi:hypothetical protein
LLSLSSSPSSSLSSLSNLVKEENDVDEESQSQSQIFEVVEVSGKQTLQNKTNKIYNN